MDDSIINCSSNQTVTTDSSQDYTTVTLPPVTSTSDNSGMTPTITIDVDGSPYMVNDNVNFQSNDVSTYGASIQEQTTT